MAGVPDALATPVLRALSKNPAARQPSVHAFAVELAAGAAEVFGPGWLARTGLHLCLDSEVEFAAGAHPEPAPEPGPGIGPAPGPGTDPDPAPGPGADPEPGRGPGPAPAGPAAAPGWVPALAAEEPTDPPPPHPDEARPPRRNKRLRMAVAGFAALLAVIAAVLLVNRVYSPFGQDAASGSTQTSSPTPTAVPEGTGQPDTTPGTAPGGTTTPAAPVPTTAAASTPPPAPPAPPTPSPVFEPVVILNTSNIQGQAEAAVERVEAAGFRVDRVGNFTATYNVPVSTVFYDPGHEAAARTMLDRVPGVEKIVPKSETNIQSSDPLILVVTRDFPTT